MSPRNFPYLTAQFLRASSQGVHIQLGTPLPDSSNIAEGHVDLKSPRHCLKYFLANESRFAFLQKVIVSESTHFRKGLN